MSVLVVGAAGGVVVESVGAGVDDAALDEVDAESSSEGLGSFKGTGQA